MARSIGDRGTEGLLPVLARRYLIGYRGIRDHKYTDIRDYN